jgi:hypothetical protein
MVALNHGVGGNHQLPALWRRNDRSVIPQVQRPWAGQLFEMLGDDAEFRRYRGHPDKEGLLF